MMLKNFVDGMDMVENSKRKGCILVGQPVEITADHIVETAIGPSLDFDELGVWLSHADLSSPLIFQSPST